MPKRTIESLGALVKSKRDKKKLRETAKEIGIGPATLMRVESGHVPDLTTFGKICHWLKADPGDFLGFTQNKPAEESDGMAKLSAHFRADRMPQRETIQAIAQMITLALKTQPQAQSE
jgi:transcriptional regulator with XRE-family HTH domain